MFNFSKKKKKEENEAVDAAAYLDQEDTTTTDEMETTLSIPDNWNVSNEERYVYAFHNNEAPNLKVNQISIYGMEILKQNDNQIVVTGLIRNTVPKTVKFAKTNILLLGSDQKVIAKKEFDLARLGNIPANGARPWKFVFGKEDIKQKPDAPLRDWTLAFELKKKHQLDLEESWEKSIADETKTKLEQIVSNAPSLKPGEVNFMGLDAKQKDSGDLVVTILIRNGSEKNISLQQVPLGVKDASGDEVAKGGFKLEDFSVKANTSKPWTFIFPTSMITKEDIDLSRWQVYPLQ
ncbi:accessory Sec system S-layer assembly protein [Oceanobacillus halotolerans]|uniref:accessory Sec system S-layer assembly protein n=1 Tax=Oceanobacillus halotolerans TaxID=2663380 RepID=UPI0013DB206A|nr:accessory Sec system S-layer assembly protein [Oceanobacillus halotolerans]